MPEKITFLKLAELTLEKEKRPLTPTQIWELSKGTRVAAGFVSEGKTPWQSISARIRTDIQTNPNSPFYQSGHQPAEFYLKRLQVVAPKNNQLLDLLVELQRPFQERDLHPLLVKFVRWNEHFGAVCRTIYHEGSSRKSNFSRPSQAFKFY